MSAHELRRCLETRDVAGIRQLWAKISPHLPQPRTDAEALISLHHARTQAESIPLDLRVYSHKWLTECGLPSGLPDHMKPKQEQIHPQIVSAVGVAVRSISGQKNELAARIEKAMSDAVMEAYHDGKTDPEFIKKRMMEAREKVKNASA